MGTVTLADTFEKKKKKVILVDHNSYTQSIEGIEEANILEIVDHHNIGSIGTNSPINFRNMPVGSSNTIIYQMYKENGIKILANKYKNIIPQYIYDVIYNYKVEIND